MHIKRLLVESVRTLFLGNGHWLGSSLLRSLTNIFLLWMIQDILGVISWYGRLWPLNESRCFFWLLIRGRLLTNEECARWGMTQVPFLWAMWCHFGIYIACCYELFFCTISLENICPYEILEMFFQFRSWKMDHMKLKEWR